MTDPLGALRRFLAELRRRKVYRAAVVYLAVALASLELVDALVPATTLPPWADELFVALAILGFPLVLTIAWTYDITPDGVRRTTSTDAVRTDGEGGSSPATAA